MAEQGIDDGAKLQLVVDPAPVEDKRPGEGEQQTVHVAANAPSHGGLLNFIPVGLMILVAAFVFHQLALYRPNFCPTGMGITETSKDYCADFKIESTEHVC